MGSYHLQVAILVPDDKLDCFGVLRKEFVQLFIRDQNCHRGLMAPHWLWVRFQALSLLAFSTIAWVASAYSKIHQKASAGYPEALSNCYNNWINVKRTFNYTKQHLSNRIAFHNSQSLMTILNMIRSKIERSKKMSLIEITNRFAWLDK